MVTCVPGSSVDSARAFGYRRRFMAAIATQPLAFPRGIGITRALADAVGSEFHRLLLAA